MTNHTAKCRAKFSGFTLIEVLVALAIMSVLAALGWRVIDGMARTQASTAAHVDEVVALQSGLSQWSTDLDAVVQMPQMGALDWNGQVLRITRRGIAAPGEGVLVVAWTRRHIEGVGQWLRWQSPPLTSRSEWDLAWQQALIWAQNPGDEEKKREVAVAALDEWQIFYFRSDAWTNPLSSDAAAPGGVVHAAPVSVPEGVRLVLNIPNNRAVGGKLTLDWVRPTVGGGR